MVKRLAAAIGVFMFLSALFGAVVASLFLRNRGTGPTAAAALGILFLVVVLAIRFRRGWSPLGGLVDAVDRLAEGDLAVRIPEVGRGPDGRVARSFNVMAERLESSDRLRRQMLADVGHELRTPLTVIRGGLEAISDGIRSADETSLESMIEQTRVMERLIDDLRLMSLNDAGMLELHTEPVDVGHTLEELVESYRPTAQRHGLSLASEISSSVVIEADPIRLTQAFANILANALRFTPSGGRVSVRASTRANEFFVVIDDSGPGIADADIGTVFERFVKGVDSGGSGLGLSIARDLIVAHQGTIEAHNRPEGGLSVLVSIPRG